MDAFKALTSGTRFSVKKNQSTIDLFKGKETNPNKKDNAKKSKVLDGAEENVFEKEDEVNAFRNRLHIRAKGENIPNPAPTFNQMSIHKEVKQVILKNIEESKWKEPTPIQMQSIPVLLSRRDILAAAPTGSGKTASYVIPVLSRLMKPETNHGVRALLLAPTKELADQIFHEVQRLGHGKKFKVCNLKKNIMHQATSQEGKMVFNKFDILVATPLRLVALIHEGCIDLSKVEMIMLDEADKLLDIDSHQRSNIAADDDDEDNDDDLVQSGQKSMSEHDDQDEPTRIRSSFLSQIDEILSQCTNTTSSSSTTTAPKSTLQRALFSATIGPFVRELASTFLVNPVQVTIGQENTGASSIQQQLVFVGREDGKLLAIRQLIQQGIQPPVLVFVQSIERAKALFQELIFDGINVDVIHANRSSHQREEILRKFRLGEVWVLICTDLLARGIDIYGVNMVINYDLPQSAISYIHRIGRTGRGGRQGKAITYFTEHDIPNLRSIANVVKLSGCEVPDWMLAIKPLSTKDKRQLRRSAPERRHIQGKIKEVEGEIQAHEEEDGEGKVKNTNIKKLKKSVAGQKRPKVTAKKEIDDNAVFEEGDHSYEEQDNNEDVYQHREEDDVEQRRVPMKKTNKKSLTSKAKKPVQEVEIALEGMEWEGEEVKPKKKKKKVIAADVFADDVYEAETNHDLSDVPAIKKKKGKKQKVVAYEENEASYEPSSVDNAVYEEDGGYDEYAEKVSSQQKRKKRRVKHQE